jgi:hypothetical protein
MLASKVSRAVLVCILASFALGVIPCLAQSQATTPSPLRKIDKKRPTDTPETLFGERLFLETRFAQYFAAHSKGNVNRHLELGDPVVAKVTNPRAGVPYPGPFAGKSMNCRSCHFVDEFSSYIAGTNRSYTDFLPRSPIPERGDRKTLTTRNSRSLVDASIPRHTGTLLHGDGEFLNSSTLVEGTFTGRNFGWLPSEHERALQQIARVIREDDGRDDLGQQYGGSYAKLMLGTADIPERFRLSSEFRINVKTATDRQIIDEVNRLVVAYLNSLRFERNAQGIHSGSGYDLFLAKNGLPAAPAEGETDLQYCQRLLRELEALSKPKFVKPYERWSRLHPHVFEFSEQEIAGLKLFLRQNASPSPNLSAKADSVSHVGNCVACHAAPEFTDFRFHNTGAAQEEYDAVHGSGSFARMAIPSYAERSRHPDRSLPATLKHPLATGVFSSIPSLSNPSATDLGMWNIFANADFPKLQHQMGVLLCGTQPCNPHSQLPHAIALFRTPSLRDLGHSEPYLHTGRMPTIEDVLHFYVRMSGLQRAGQLRNGDPELGRISLNEEDIAALAAFLRSIDEDYDN